MSAEIHDKLIIDLETALNALRDKNSVIAFECVQNALERLNSMQPSDLERRSLTEERLVTLREWFKSQSLDSRHPECRIYESVATSLGGVIQQVFNERQ